MERTFTLQEALEIWDAGFEKADDLENEPNKIDYFRERFGIEVEIPTVPEDFEKGKDLLNDVKGDNEWKDVINFGNGKFKRVP